MHGHSANARNHHDHAHHHPAGSDRRYTIAIALNLGFVALEAAAGFFANSTALLFGACGRRRLARETSGWRAAHLRIF
jgi:cobalt-zinc-cadmium efflux system protein